MEKDTKMEEKRKFNVTDETFPYPDIKELERAFLSMENTTCEVIKTAKGETLVTLSMTRFLSYSILLGASLIASSVRYLAYCLTNRKHVA